jgi:deoxyribodipyrimidine photo-lyase
LPTRGDDPIDEGSEGGGAVRTLVWFRGKDLRIADHAPLRDAAKAGEVIPLFVLDPFFFSPERAVELPHRMQFLLDSLASLAKNLAHAGSRLVVVEGKATEVVPRLARDLRVDRVVAHRWVEPFGRERDRRVAAALHVPFDLHEGETLVPPGTIRNGSGSPFSVYTPFARAVRKVITAVEPLAAPKKLPPLPADVRVREVPLPTLESLGLAHNPRIQAGGEREARARLAAFVGDRILDYADARDRLDEDGTSRLSADLKFGTLSVRAVWRAAHDRGIEHPGVEKFANELLWREFAHHTLFDRPELLDEPFRREFSGFPWRDDAKLWDAWTRGETGYPVVDASARQLLGEGYVHNRARMISASFLTKHLGISFRRGEAHYLKWLTDGDWAQNDAGWQWSAGCGCDAQPYFRVFNPTSQGEKHDPEGAYVRRWVPELARLDARFIHRPWEAPADVLAKAGVVLGKTYPLPVVDHAASRARFLALAKEHLGSDRPSPL